MTGVNIRNIFGHVLNWIYPPACVSCGKPGALICEECLSKLPAVGEHFCTHCGKPLMKNHFCSLCGKSSFRFQSARAPYLYDGPVSAMIKKLKFSGMLSLVPILSQYLTEYWQNLGWEADLIVPVPLSRSRQAQRGFNQSELIARQFAKSTGIPCEGRALMKQKHTREQVGLNADERRQNLIGAFAAEPAFIRNRQILLIDDVMTTGSTFAECSAVLLDAGAKSVNCLSVATTSVNHGKQKMPDA
ncbi:MAG: ComF family protein [Flexilinea sp.]|nr:ComF family protein [Flexilinea sp.]